MKICIAFHVAFLLLFFAFSAIAANPDSVIVPGDLRITGDGNGLVFPDGSMQYSATGPQVPTSLDAICKAISAANKLLPSFCIGPNLTSIAVSPINQSIYIPIPLQFSAFGTFSDNSTQDLTTSLVWSSSNTSVATISNVVSTNGLVKAVAKGTTSITATVGNISGSTNLSAPSLFSIGITPLNASISAVTQFSALGTYSDGVQKDLTGWVVWNSSNTSVATINNGGAVSPTVAGTTSITATVGNISGSTNLSVIYIKEIPYTGNNAYYGVITAGPDGNLWLGSSAELNYNFIGRITPTGVYTQFSLPSGSGYVGEITSGPDGNLWFTETATNKIGRITPIGAFLTEYTLPIASRTYAITVGPDGNLWFTDFGSNKIGQITTAGVITEFTIPTGGSYPNGITAGPDGNLWFTETATNKIGRITTAGVITEFTITTGGSNPWEITSGPDGNLWFTDFGSNKIGQITTAGVITEFKTPTVVSEPYGITAGPDGNLWFTERNGSKIGRITTAGVITEFTISTGGSNPMGITTGPDGNLWFADPGQGAPRIGVIMLK